MEGSTHRKGGDKLSDKHNEVHTHSSGRGARASIAPRKGEKETNGGEKRRKKEGGFKKNESRGTLADDTPSVSVPLRGHQ